MKIGVFGVWRGLAFIQAVGMMEDAEITAICDQDKEKLDEAKKHCPENVRVCEDFEALLDSGIDAVILCNYFNEHAPYAIRALRRGIAVLSETLPAATLRECAELVETVELLAGGQMDMEAVYHAVGYISLSTFRRNFIKYTGRNPGDFNAREPE